MGDDAPTLWEGKTIIPRGDNYHICWYGMCHFGVPFCAENKFWVKSFLVKSQVVINFGVSS